ncbi:helix-turn-helix domain-containing protein [Actinomadura sp. SCN-SB]|uniref:helix-turn-helix domain-containing protein n=1 Tax=Actinomadura sp. SCN-SB TaxID=3373092 RepID=UPI00375368BC
MSEQPPNVPPSMRLFKVEDVMAMLSLGRNTVFELIRTGRLRSVKEGRSRLIPGSAIAEYIQLLEREADHAA